MKKEMKERALINLTKKKKNILLTAMLTKYIACFQHQYHTEKKNINLHVQFNAKQAST